MDQIIVEDLQIYAYHGVYQQENEKGQNFYVSVVLDTDTRAAGMEDDLGSIEPGKHPGIVLLEGVDMNAMKIGGDTRARRLV